MTKPWNRLAWSLAEWIDYAGQIEGRRCGRPRYDACTRHVQRFPGELVAVELDARTLERLAHLIRHSHPSMFGRPNRGARGNHWTTPVFMAAQNQLARLRRIQGRNAPA